MTRLPAALVLSAGLGTRMRPLTWVRAKPAAPVANVPLLVRILRGLAAQGVIDVVINLHHRPETITRLVGDGRWLNLSVRYSWEQPVLGSAGGPRRALALLDTDPFLIVNGDTLTDVNLASMMEAHEASDAWVTLAGVRRDDSRYGRVLTDDEGRVTGFSRPGQAQGLHFVGVQVASHVAFARLPDGVPVDSVGGTYRDLVAKRPGSLRAWQVEASFWDIGTPSDYLATCLEFAEREGTTLMPGTGSRIDSTSRVERTVLWDHVTIGRGCDLADCVVADSVTVPDGSHFRGCAIVRAAACPPDSEGDRVGDLLVAAIPGVASAEPTPSSTETKT